MFDTLLRDLLITAVVFVPLERLMPRRKNQALLRENVTTDSLYSVVGQVIIIFSYLLLFAFVLTVLRPLVPVGAINFVAAQHVLLQFVALLVVADLVYYTVHRAFHQIPFLWRFHAIHHSIEEMDWLASHRVHPFDQVMTRGLSLVVPLLFGFADGAFVLFGLFSGWHSYLKHSNVNINFGPLQWLIVSPVYHHWHHANEEDAYDKNFAGQLPILDLMFKTALMKGNQAPVAYGTDTPVPKGFLKQLWSPFQEPKAIKQDEMPPSSLGKPASTPAP